MWPFSAMSSGSRSSVQNAIRPGPYSTASGQECLEISCHRRLADRAATCRHAAVHALPPPSGTRDRSGCPAVAYAWSPLPRRPGCVAVDVLGTRESELLELGRERRRRRRGSSSSRPARARDCGASATRGRRAPSARRGDSNGDAGTHDGAMKKTSSWRSAEASSSQWTPSVPSTFAISCGSATTAVVPSGSTSRANSSTSSFTDSRCMWASMKPGTT